MDKETEVKRLYKFSRDKQLLSDKVRIWTTVCVSQKILLSHFAMAWEEPTSKVKEIQKFNKCVCFVQVLFWASFLDFYSFFNFSITWKLSFCFQWSKESWPIQAVPYLTLYRSEVTTNKCRTARLLVWSTKVALIQDFSPHIFTTRIHCSWSYFNHQERTVLLPYLGPTSSCALFVFYIIIKQDNFLKFPEWRAKRKWMNSSTYQMHITAERRIISSDFWRTVI